MTDKYTINSFQNTLNRSENNPDTYISARCIDCKVSKPLLNRTICRICRERREQKRSESQHCSL